MRTYLAALTLVLLFAVATDASARICPRNKNFPLVDKGMTLEQVTKLIGKPDSAESGPQDSKVLFYCLASSFLDTDGSDTREYWVQMMDGKVVGYGERNDPAAMRRAQLQYANAWALVNSVSRAADSLGDTHAAPHINVEQTSVIQVISESRPPESEAKPKPEWQSWKPL